jgi:hypothetical protein
MAERGEEDRRPARRDRGLSPVRRGAATALLLLVLATGLLARIPILWNADSTLSADEAVNALVIQHLLAGREIALFNWDADYFGIVEGLLAIPLVLLLGFVPLAFKLAAVAGFLALVVAVQALGRRLYGPRAGLAAAALLALFSPQLVLWSTLAAVGYCLMAAWGTLTLLHFDRLLRRPTPAGFAGLGLLAGFGLYLYQLYLVYVALLLAWAAWALAGRLLARGAGRRGQPVAGPRFVPARLLRVRVSGAATRLRGTNRGPVRLARAAGLLAAGFALGWAPRLALLVAGGGGGKRPSYGLAGADRLAANLQLLLRDCAPALLGANPLQRPELHRWVGPIGARGALLGVPVLLAYLTAWLWGMARARRELAGATGLLPGLPGIECLLALLPPLTALLFVLSPNPADVLASRFLLPWLSSLPVLAGGMLAWLARRSRPAAAALAFLLVVYPAERIAVWNLYLRYVDHHLRPVQRAEPLHSVVAYLERQGIRGGYGGYWVAYNATMLSGERVIVAPFDDWDRYPAYSRFVDGLDRAAYLFQLESAAMDPAMAARVRWQRERFRNRLESSDRPYRAVRVGFYLLFHGPHGERLFPPALAAAPVALREPRAEIALGAVPAVAAPGERLRIPVRLTNRSDGFWSAAGLTTAAGSLAVAASYRWFDAAGRTLDPNGERSLLPRDLRPGESLDMVVRAPAPPAAGTYGLEITLVQENVAWFDQATGSASRRVQVAVRAP